MCDLHEQQLRIWEAEHRSPAMLPFLDSDEPSLGVVEFWTRKLAGKADLEGLEIGCGKGRNVRWLATKGVETTGLDFSPYAIEEAKRRSDKGAFILADACQPWPFPEETFDFVIDCWASADIESAAGRQNVRDEAHRVLRQGGLYFLQIDTPDTGLFKRLIQELPGPEKDTILLPNGKVEALLSRKEIATWNHPLRIVDLEFRLESELEVFGYQEPYEYIWLVAEKPAA